MFRTVANKNGTIEINGNQFRFSQPVEEYKNDDIERIEESYSKQMDFISDDPHYVTADNVELRNGQVVFEYNLQSLKMFDHLRALFLEDKLYYYRSLLEIAKRAQANEVNILWQKDNFAVDLHEKSLKCMVVEHEVFKLHNQKDTVAAVKELIILSLTTMQKVLGKPKRSDFLEQKEEVIRFAEKVYLRSKTLNEIEEHINSEIYLLEMSQQEEQQEQSKQNKLTALLNTAKSKMDRLIDHKRDKEKNLNSGSTQPKKTSKSDKKTVIWAFGAVFVALILSLVLNNINENQSSPAIAKDKEQPTQEDVKKVYQESFFEEPEITISKLEDMGIENLSEDDQNVLNQLYIEADQYEVALQNDPDTAGAIAHSMYQKEDYESLNEFVEDLEQENTEASLYQARANEDWARLLELKEEISPNAQQANMILTAFFQTEDVSGGEEYLKSLDSQQTTESMTERIEKAKAALEKKAQLEKELAAAEKELADEDDKDKEEELEEKVNNLKSDIGNEQENLKEA